MENYNKEMSNFEVINTARQAHGYCMGHFKTYKKYCNRMRKATGEAIYRLESNLAKFKMTGACSFLCKNRRLLDRAVSKSTNDSFEKIYLQYTECLINSKKNKTDIDLLVSLRHLLANYYSFLDEIYFMAENRHDFEQYKIKHMWNDIQITFETKALRNSFLDGTFCINDSRFNTQLAKRILDLEKYKKLLVYSGERDCLRCFQLATALLNAVKSLERFLSDNFVDSEFVCEFMKSTVAVLAFIKKLAEYSTGKIDGDIEVFRAPKYFEEFTGIAEEMRRTRRIDPDSLRKILIDVVEKRLHVEEKTRKMPLLPVFYDIADDYVEYSSVNNSVAGILQMFNFFNK